MVMAVAVVTVAMVATVRARRNLLRQKPVAMAVRRANPKVHRARPALHCSAASRVAKALAAQVGAIRRVPDSAGVELLCCGWRRG
jgi:hypothetical protein